VEDIFWAVVTVLLVIVSLVVLALGFPGSIGKRAKTRLMRRRDTAGAQTPDARARDTP
jgi:hypothetical protein